MSIPGNTEFGISDGKGGVEADSIALASHRLNVDQACEAY